MPRQTDDLIPMLSRVAAVLSSGASTRDRMLDVLGELRIVLPFEAAMLTYVHPLTGTQQPLLTLGYSDASRTVSPAPSSAASSSIAST